MKLCFLCPEKRGRTRLDATSTLGMTLGFIFDWKQAVVFKHATSKKICTRAKEHIHLAEEFNWQQFHTLLSANTEEMNYTAETTGAPWPIRLRVHHMDMNGATLIFFKSNLRPNILNIFWHSVKCDLFRESNSQIATVAPNIPSGSGWRNTGFSSIS